MSAGSRHSRFCRQLLGFRRQPQMSAGNVKCPPAADKFSPPTTASIGRQPTTLGSADNVKFSASDFSLHRQLQISAGDCVSMSAGSRRCPLTTPKFHRRVCSTGVCFPPTVFSTDGCKLCWQCQVPAGCFSSGSQSASRAL